MGRGLLGACTWFPPHSMHLFILLILLCILSLYLILVVSKTLCWVLRSPSNKSTGLGDPQHGDPTQNSKIHCLLWTSVLKYCLDMCPLTPYTNALSHTHILFCDIARIYLVPCTTHLPWLGTFVHHQKAQLLQRLKANSFPDQFLNLWFNQSWDSTWSSSSCYSCSDFIVQS